MSEPINPLPEDEVGYRLLVKLQAEKVIEKLNLKEAWEEDDGWQFDDLCAVVACTLGEGFVNPGEYEVAGRMLCKHASVISKIAEKAAPVLIDEPGDGGTFVKPEVYQGLLILGLGTKEVPLETSASATDTGKLVEALALALDVDEKRIDGRKFEHAKREVKRRYAEHQEKMRTRKEHGYQSRAVHPSNAEMLKAAWRRLGVTPPRFPTNPAAPRRSRDGK